MAIRNRGPHVMDEPTNSSHENGKIRDDLQDRPAQYQDMRAASFLRSTRRRPGGQHDQILDQRACRDPYWKM